MMVNIYIFIVYTLIGIAHGVFEANKCLPNTAFYNDTILLCQCQEGFKGLGDLCCDDPDEWSNCNIGGDPWLSTYDGTRFPYNWPCVSRVAVATGTTGSDNQCTVEVMTSSNMVERGAQYPGSVAVVFTIGDGGRQTFKFVGNTVQRPGDTETYPASELYTRRLFRMRLQGENIRISYDSVRLFWTLTGCDTKIIFRPAQETKAVQYNRPGVCVSVRKSSNTQPTGQVANGDVCSASSTSGQTSLQQLSFKILADVLKDGRTVDEDSKTIHPEYQSSCTGVNNVLTQVCDVDANNIQPAVTACVSLFYSGPIRLCMSLLGVTGPQVIDMFSSCLRFQCQPNAAGCDSYVDNNEAIKICLPSFCQL